jgi:hypothetical protein
MSGIPTGVFINLEHSMVEQEGVITREQVEYAAKAVGYELLWSSVEGIPPRLKPTFDYWNPSGDDAHAFRLASDLDMKIEHVGRSGKPSTQVNCQPRGRGDCASVLSYAENGGKLAATRKAIFDVAVQVGMSMVDGESLEGMKHD